MQKARQVESMVTSWMMKVWVSDKAVKDDSQFPGLEKWGNYGDHSFIYWESKYKDENSSLDRDQFHFGHVEFVGSIVHSSVDIQLAEWIINRGYISLSAEVVKSWE